MKEILEKRQWNFLSQQSLSQIASNKELIEFIQSDKDIYFAFVRFLSEYSWQLFKASKIEYGKKRTPKGLHLDHCLSISEGFSQHIDPFVISHPCNLEIISAKKNWKKGKKSSKNLEELLNEIEEFGKLF